MDQGPKYDVFCLRNILVSSILVTYVKPASISSFAPLMGVTVKYVFGFCIHRLDFLRAGLACFRFLLSFPLQDQNRDYYYDNNCGSNAYPGPRYLKLLVVCWYLWLGCFHRYIPEAAAKAATYMRVT